jgi:hypothetical protein
MCRLPASALLVDADPLAVESHFESSMEKMGKKHQVWIH